MTDDERDEYFHRVEVTQAMVEALASQIAAHNAQVWDISFSQAFQFRLVDRSHSKVTRDYGYYETWGDLVAKLRRLFPDIVLDKLLLT